MANPQMKKNNTLIALCYILPIVGIICSVPTIVAETTNVAFLMIPFYALGAHFVVMRFVDRENRKLSM